ncbi:EcsC family protein [Lentzea cavernae]|uniref:EcsC family protein n=1 Tax=Lentzea cavernae TaxID=2020703 RepID=UPI001E2C2735|nr:EcsC family protein [Lentzea cavernae]
MVDAKNSAAPADPPAVLEEPESPGGAGQAILDLVDKAIGLQTSMVRKNIARARQRNPESTPAEVIGTLEKMYVSALTSTGAAVGGAAAAPGVGTGISLALSAGEALTSLELSTLYVLSVAEIHGIPLDEIERRRTLVLGILLGESGSKSIGKVAERTGQHWARQLVSAVPTTTLKQINKVLGKNFVTKYGTKQGIVVLGRAVPFGIGALIGGAANATMAAFTVRAARHAFGPAPESWPAEIEPAQP